MRFKVAISLPREIMQGQDIDDVIRAIESEHFDGRYICGWLTDLIKEIPGFDSVEYQNAVPECGDFIDGPSNSFCSAEYPYFIDHSEADWENMKLLLTQKLAQLGYPFAVNIHICQ